MSKREPLLLIEDIIDSGNKIIEYTNNLSYNDFTNDSKTIDANFWQQMTIQPNKLTTTKL